ncbi:hypothetical protein CR513_37651, partial [Mucuna pruriens]
MCYTKHLITKGVGKGKDGKVCRDFARVLRRAYRNMWLCGDKNHILDQKRCEDNPNKVHGHRCANILKHYPRATDSKQVASDGLNSPPMHESRNCQGGPVGRQGVLSREFEVWKRKLKGINKGDPHKIFSLDPAKGMKIKDHNWLRTLKRLTLNPKACPVSQKKRKPREEKRAMVREETEKMLLASF